MLADEQESMIDRYLERGEMFVLNDDRVKAECVISKTVYQRHKSFMADK